MKCLNCDNVYESKRSDSRFCSKQCRAKYAKRNFKRNFKRNSGLSATRTRTTGCSVAIPGDEDYEGVCEQVDGVWRVKKSEPCRKVMT